MKKYLSIFLLIGGVLAISIFFYHQQESSERFEQPVMTEASGIGPEKDKPAFVEISPQMDCANECSSFKDNAEQYTYCRTVCGFTSEEGVATPSTSTDPSLSNDYTLREDAIRDHDIRKCTLITDINIRNTCQARVAEDLLEQKSSTPVR